jgi:hypothetical protein
MSVLKIMFISHVSMLQPGRLWVQVPMRLLIFFTIYLILPAALGPGVYSAYNRNVYRKQKNMFPGSRSWPAGKYDNLAANSESIVKTMWDPQYLTTL